MQLVHDFVKANHGISYSLEMMNNYKKEALDMLEKFPESPSKTSLIALVNYTIERSH